MEPTVEISREATKSAKTANDNIYSILLVDDEERVLKALKRLFIDDKYNIFAAGNAAEALETLKINKVHLVISDNNMPGLLGIELLKIIRNKYPDTIRIMLTAHSDTDIVMAAVNEGAVYKFITKPWNVDDLRLTVRLALKQYELIQENKSLKNINNRQLTEIQKLKNYAGADHSTLGGILLTKKLLIPGQFEMVEKYRKQLNVILVKAIIDLGMIEINTLLRVIQEAANVDYIPFEAMELNPEMSQIFPRVICEAGCLVPLRQEGKNLHIAMADPLDLYRIEYLKFSSQMNIIPHLALISDLEKAVAFIYEGPESVRNLEYSLSYDSEKEDEIDIVLDETEADTTEQLLAKSSAPPAIKMVNTIISEAIKSSASDIHVEPKPHRTLVRYRIDGLLQDRIRIPSSLHMSIVSRLKILARMDIAERRIPQDGRITVKTENKFIDIRVSSLPTINGEKIVMRLLDKGAEIITLEKIGIRGLSGERLKNIANTPKGMIIATGPTGSGKTTSLYSLINYRLKDSQNFVTIEDPVEYYLERASQVHIRSKINLTFATTLRAALRQDPDVILVGEIRDLETAEVAFQAAMTGHLVFTTLHTNDAIATISRLFHLGVEPYLVASAVQCIFAQRLVRKVCPHCKKLNEYDKDLLRLLGAKVTDYPDKLYYGAGCSRCGNTGYLGRTGLFEVYQMNEEFRYFLTTNYRETELLNLARALGMETLLEDGLSKVIDGLTTLEELFRVLGPAAESDYPCKKCGKLLDIKFNICPYCGTKQRKICQSCNSQIQDNWLICPYCGESKL